MRSSNVTTGPRWRTAASATGSANRRPSTAAATPISTEVRVAGHRYVRFPPAPDKRRAAALGEPADQHADRDADAYRHHRRHRDEHRNHHAPQRVGRRQPPGALADARVVRVTTQLRLAEQEHHAQRDRDERECGRAGRTEPELVLRVHIEGEGLEFEPDKGVELDQRVEHDQQHPAVDRRLQLRQHDSEEGSGSAEPERAAGLLERGVEAAKRHRDEQEHDRVVAERDDSRRTDEPLERGAEVRPRVARYERRDRQRHHQQHRPHAPAGQRRAFDEPRAGNTDDGADRRRRGRDLERMQDQGRAWRSTRSTCRRRKGPPGPPG